MPSNLRSHINDCAPRPLTTASQAAACLHEQAGRRLNNHNILQRARQLPAYLCSVEYTQPAPFLDVVVQELDELHALTGLCAGYEAGAWRHRQLAKWLMRSLPEFALTYSEFQDFRNDPGSEALERAFHSVYVTDKYGRRGEFGELLLHVALRQVFNSVPAISKIYFKDSANDTVKGFDAVHVIAREDDVLELWLGEVKFYESLKSAIAAVATELIEHMGTSYLRREFTAILGKVDPNWPHASSLRSQLASHISLDAIFPNITVPVMLTYDSPSVAARVSELGKLPAGVTAASSEGDYHKIIADEFRAGWMDFRDAAPALAVKVQLILVPLHLKKVLLQELDERLKAWQRVMGD